MNYKYLRFRTDIAEDVGTNAATVFQYLFFWIAKNKKEKRNFQGGSYWTYNTQKQILEDLQFLTRDKLQYALKKLINGGYIIKGRYNKNPYDRTTWYSLGEKGLELLDELEQPEQPKVKVKSGKLTVKKYADINDDDLSYDFLSKAFAYNYDFERYIRNEQPQLIQQLPERMTVGTQY